MRKFLLNLVIILIFIANTSIVKAESTAITLKSEKQEYGKGENVTITIELNNDNIYGLKGKIEYDEKVFEKIEADELGSVDNIISLNNWENVTYNSETNEFITYTINKIEESKEIIKITLKVKEDVNVKQTQIALKNMQVSDGESDINIEDTVINISIKNNIQEVIPTKAPIQTPNNDTHEDKENKPIESPIITPEQTANETAKPIKTPSNEIEKPTKTPSNSIEIIQTPKTESNQKTIKTENKTSSKLNTNSVVKNIKTGDSKVIISIILVFIAGILIIINIIFMRKKK